MFASLAVRKFARLSLSAVAAGATVAFVFLGAPADAATLSGRGMAIAAGRGML